MKHVKIKSYNDEEWIIPLSQPSEQRINEIIKKHKIRNNVRYPVNLSEENLEKVNKITAKYRVGIDLTNDIIRLYTNQIKVNNANIVALSNKNCAKIIYLDENSHKQQILIGSDEMQAVIEYWRKENKELQEQLKELGINEIKSE